MKQVLSRRCPVAILAVVGVTILGGLAIAQEQDKAKSNRLTEKRVVRVLAPDSTPCPKVRFYGFAQFSKAHPNWFSIQTGAPENQKPLETDKDGTADWRFASLDKLPASIWVVSADESLGAFLTRKQLEEKDELTVQLVPTVRLRATFSNPQADAYGIPFLHRGYLYRKNGDRIGQMVGKRADIIVPQGDYELGGYNGNPNSLLAEVPRFRVQFSANQDKPTTPIVVSGQVDIEQENQYPESKFANLGEFYYTTGNVTLEPNTLDPMFLGKHPLAIEFEGVDGESYRGKEVFVADLDQRNTFIYYGEFPKDGKLDLGTLKKGNYRITVDGHSTKECRKIELNDDAEVADKTVMPPMPGYALEQLHLLNPETMEKESLEQFKGKVVYIEFWASWCSPCMQAMNHVESVLSKKKAAWGDRVSLVAVNVNENPADVIEKFSKQFGWRSFSHMYGGDKDANDWDAPILKQLQASGIPLAILIDADGTMIWRGHPESIDVDQKIDAALKSDSK